MALDLAVQAQNLSKVTLLRDKCIKHFLSPSPSPLPSSSSSSSPLPSSIPPPEIPQRISDFFTGKIIAIRNNLDSQTVPLPAVSHHRFPGTPVTDFQPVSELTVKPSYRSPLSNLWTRPAPSVSLEPMSRWPPPILFSHQQWITSLRQLSFNL